MYCFLTMGAAMVLAMHAGFSFLEVGTVRKKNQVNALIAGAVFVYGFTYMQNKLKIDDVLGVIPLHGVCGAWGGIAAGIFGTVAMGGAGGVTFMSQLVGTLAGVGIAIAGGYLVYGGIKAVMGIRMTEEDEHMGADLAIHHISSNPEEDMQPR